MRICTTIASLLPRFARAWNALLTDAEPQPAATPPPAIAPKLASNQVNALDPNRVQAIETAHPVDLSSQLGSTIQSLPDSSASVCQDWKACAGAITEVDDHQTELAAVGKVLGLLEGQLKSINQDVESSVVGICSGFHGMAQRAQAAVVAAQNATTQNATTQNATSSGTTATNNDPTLEMQKVLEALLKNVQASCQFSQSAAAKLLHLEQRLASVEKIVGEVEDIAGRAKMVALNGRIEAARLGETGKAFGVVAQETKELADKAAQTSQAIRQSITKLAVELAGTTAEMRLRAESDTVGFQQTNVVARELLNKLDITHRQMSDSMENTVNISMALQADIAKAVMSLQFQDRVSQCVIHVMETLSGLVDRIDPWCASANPNEAQQHFESWQREIAARYTMDSERDMSARPLVNLLTGKAQEGKAQLAACSVELF